MDALDLQRAAIQQASRYNSKPKKPRDASLVHVKAPPLTCISFNEKPHTVALQSALHLC